MIKYPIQFKSTTSSSNGMNSAWKSTSGDFSSSLAIPPEFEGPGGALSPEDLFNQALSNCFVATFKVYAEMSKLTFQNLSVESNLTVDLDDKKKPIMKRLDVVVQIQNPSDADRALLLAEKASKSGFILNSVKTECHFDFQVV